MKILKIVLIFSIFSLNWGCYMKKPRLSDIEIIRNDLIKDGRPRASEIPIRECTPKQLTSFAKDFKLYKVHVGAFSPKDPIPPPIYKVIDSDGNVIVDVIMYLNKKGFVPKSNEEAVEAAIAIVQLDDIDSTWIIAGQNKLFPGLLENNGDPSIKDYLFCIKRLSEDIRNRISGPSVKTSGEGYEVLLYVYFRDENTMGKLMDEYILKKTLLIHKGNIKSEEIDLSEE